VTLQRSAEDTHKARILMVVGNWHGRSAVVVGGICPETELLYNGYGEISLLQPRRCTGWNDGTAVHSDLLLLLFWLLHHDMGPKS
jgi:hypothetical protein